jgi:3-hydroxy-9,10-secoandrosta-1,3,5(10)-triene-9,17-dione monooxygenase
MKQTINPEKTAAPLSTKPKPHGAPTASEMIAAANGLVPFLRDQAAQCESLRRVSDATIERLVRGGFFNVVKPRRYGGYEMGWDVFSDVVIALASGCGSTGWVYSVVGGHAPVVARFGTDFLDELWGADPDALVSSCRRVSGEIAPVAGGYRGGGVGAFSSGCLNADWVIVEGVPVAGQSRPLTVVIPLAEVEILDSWNVVGLAGTGSHDIRFRDLFIPEHRTWFPGKTPQGDALDGPLFRTLFLGGPFALPSVVLGIAIAGLEHFAAMTHGRSARQGGSMADLQSMQMRIGESAIEIDAALALLRSKLKELMTTLSRQPLERRGEHRVLPAGGTSHGHDQAATGFIAYRAYAALDRLMVAAGAGQLALSAPFQRCFRDALAGIQQPSNNWDNGRTAGGRELLARFKPSAISD